MPTVANIYYHAYQEGEKLPVILLHGAGGSHLSWPSGIRRLPGYKVFALDLPGHGKSGGRGLQSISRYAEAVLDWLESMGMHSAVFVGHSMGSAIAQTLALDHAGHVLGLALIGSATRMRVNPILIEETAHETTFRNAVGKVIAWSFSPQTSEELKALVAHRLGQTRPSVLHSDFLACDAYDVTSRICQISQPALVISGAEDRMTPVRHAYFLVDSLPNAQLQVIEGAGHMVMIEKPAEVAGALTRFLAGIPY
jgi:pimeloyl-ACP methyl ester carboxylesterase